MTTMLLARWTCHAYFRHRTTRCIWQGNRCAGSSVPPGSTGEVRGGSSLRASSVPACGTHANRRAHDAMTSFDPKRRSVLAMWLWRTISRNARCNCGDLQPRQRTRTNRRARQRLLARSDFCACTKGVSGCESCISTFSYVLW